jgi:hypothetical protein
MSDSDTDNDWLLRDLDALYEYELRQAAVSESHPAKPAPRAKRLPTGPLAIMATAVLVLLAVAGRPTPHGQRGSGASGGPTESNLAALASPLPTSTPLMTPMPGSVFETPGPLVDGVPESFGGQPVFRGPTLASRIVEASSEEPFLAGGWFHEGEVIRFCSFRRFDRAVDLCYSFGLYDSAARGDPVWIGQGDDGLLPTGLSEESNQAVVLLVHTHDPRCSSDDTGCATRPVLSQIVWLGTPS